MSRFGAVLVFCLACCLSLAQDLTQPVDYTIRAKPLRLVLADLTKKTKVQLTCAQNLEEEPLILKLSGVPLKEVMDKIAGVFGGTWSKTDRGFQLSLGDEARSRHEEAIQRQAAILSKSIDSQMKAREKLLPMDKDRAASIVKELQGDNDHATMAVQALENLGVGSVFEIVAKLNLRDICRLRDRERVVYASDPTALQRPLPDITKELAELAAHCNVLADAVSRAKLPDGILQVARQMCPHLDPPFGKVVLSAYNVNGIVELLLELFDSSGNSVGRFAASAYPDFDFKTHRAAEQEVRKKVQMGVALGPNAEEIVPFAINQDRSGLRPISDETRKMLLSPTDVDPLAIATSDLALGLGQQMGLDVVYLPTDYGEVWAYIATRGGKTNLELLQKVLDRSGETQLTADDRWLTGRPSDPIDALQKRIPRPALERMLNAVSDAGCTTIDDQADFALAAGPDVDISPIRFTMWPLNEQPLEWDGFGGWASNALYASLDATQKATAAQGALRLDRNQLTGQQFELVQSWLLSNRGDLILNGLEGMAPSMDRTPISALQRERTEALLDGFGAGAFVEVTDRSEMEFHMPRRDDPSNVSPMSVEMFGEQVALSDATKTASGEPAYNLDAISTGVSRVVGLRVVLSNGYGDECSLTEDRPTSKPESLATVLQSLSPEMRRRYDKAFAKARASMGPSQQPAQSGQPGAPPR